MQEQHEGINSKTTQNKESQENQNLKISGVSIFKGQKVT